MNEEYFKLDTGQLKENVTEFRERVKEGLEKKMDEKPQLLCIPTYIVPNKKIKNARVLVLDLGGTNYRAAVVEFTNGQPVIHPKDGFSKNLSKEMKRETPPYTEEELFGEIANLIEGLDLKGVDSIGYCFSYPADSGTDGDARLLHWTKGVNIPEMLGHQTGKPLLDYLNANKEIKKKTKFTKIRVINDTVAALFSGLTDVKSQAHIGLIVGTGTNMATFMTSKNIPKLGKDFDKNLELPVNLESGNFHPKYLTVIDDKVDRGSDGKGRQRFEKAVSGMYLGEIMKYVFSCYEFDDDFDARRLTYIMNYPHMHRDEYVQAARQIYVRSAKLVASSLAGLILELVEQSTEKKITDVRLIAEGSLFWSEDRKGKNYKDLVMSELYLLLEEFGQKNVAVHVDKADNANLIGSAIAALSDTVEDLKKEKK
ncbi:MAG: hexokinase [Prevotella sp.]|jgi:hexokinase|nr:hexokinase [Prevotella sp.]